MAQIAVARSCKPVTAFSARRSPTYNRATSSTIKARLVVTTEASGSTAVGKALAGSAAAVVCATTLLTAAPAALAFDVKLGEQVFNGNCAACHTGGKNSVQVEKTLFKADLEQYLMGGFNVAAIQYQVENGKGAMPAWADRLDEDEIEAVANYVYQQASNNAW